MNNTAMTSQALNKARAVLNNGLPTREELAHARELLNAYEQELRAHEHRQFMESLEANRQFYLESADAHPQKRAYYLEEAAKHAKVIALWAN